MTAPGKERRSVGLRKIVLFELAADGDVSVTTTAVYEGIQAVGAQELTFNTPDPSKIVHRGDDVILDVDFLPAEDAIDGGFTISGVDDDLDELVSDRISFTVGNNRFIGEGTNDDADIAQVGVVVYRQSLDANGSRVWESRVIPKAKVVPMVNGASRDPQTTQFKVYPQYSGKSLWGESYAAETHGFTRAQMLRGVHNYKPKFVFFASDGVETDYALPSDAPAHSTDEIEVWVDGVNQTSGVTKATTQIQFASTQTSGAVITVLYGVN